MPIKVSTKLFLIAYCLDGVLSVAVTSNSQYIVSGSTDKSIKVFGLKRSPQVFHLENIHESKLERKGWFLIIYLDYINSVAMYDSKYVISSSFDQSIKIFDLETQKQVCHFEDAHQGNFLQWIISHCLDGITSITVTSDHRFLVSGSDDKSIGVFDLSTKQKIYEFKNAHECKLFQGPDLSLFSWNFLCGCFL